MKKKKEDEQTSIVAPQNAAYIVVNKVPPRTRPIDLEELQRLASIQCTDEELAYVLQITMDQLANYSEFIKYARLQGKISLRRHLWKRAFEDDKILIHMSKHALGMKDTIDVNQAPTHYTLSYNLEEKPK